MKIYYRRASWWFLLAVCLLILGAAAKPADAAGGSEKSISLNKTSLALKVNATATLSAAIAPASAAVETIDWQSSDPGVATVNAKGVVTGVSPGTTTIAAGLADSDSTATCTVRVKAKPAAVTFNGPDEQDGLVGVANSLAGEITSDQPLSRVNLIFRSANAILPFNDSNTYRVDYPATAQVKKVDLGQLKPFPVNGGFVPPGDYTVTVWAKAAGDEARKAGSFNFTVEPSLTVFGPQLKDGDNPTIYTATHLNELAADVKSPTVKVFCGQQLIAQKVMTPKSNSARGFEANLTVADLAAAGGLPGNSSVGLRTKRSPLSRREFNHFETH